MTRRESDRVLSALTDGPVVETSSRTSPTIAAGAGRPETS
jgi:hypothetical protein